jgi:hypothetical protein
MNKSRSKTVTIPADIQAELDQIANRTQQGRRIAWTPEQDAILVHLMDNKPAVDACVWWKKKYGWGSKESLVKRYKHLKEASNGR